MTTRTPLKSSVAASCPPGQLGHRPQQDVGRLERLDAADERDDPLVGGETECGSRDPLVAGGEGGQVDAGVCDVDSFGVGVVQRNQLPRFVFGVHDEAIGLVDDLLLTHRPQRRLRRVARGKGGVLHGGEGVRGVHQRHRPPVPGQPADLSGQPVMGMHDVVVARLVGGLGTQHPRGERAQLGGQVVLVETLEGACDDVADKHSWRHPHDRWVRGRRRAGEDLHLDAAPRQLQRGLQHVDVHPARVAGTRLGQRRGMDRQDGYAHTQYLHRRACALVTRSIQSADSAPSAWPRSGRRRARPAKPHPLRPPGPGYRTP